MTITLRCEGYCKSIPCEPDVFAVGFSFRFEEQRFYINAINLEKLPPEVSCYTTEHLLPNGCKVELFCYACHLPEIREIMGAYAGLVMTEASVLDTELTVTV